MDSEEIKDRRAQLNAVTAQFDAAIKTQLMKMPRRELEAIARMLGIGEPDVPAKEVLVDDLIAKTAQLADRLNEKGYVIIEIRPEEDE